MPGIFDQGIGQVMAIELNDVFELDVAAAVSDGCFEAFVKGRNEQLFALFIEHHSVFYGIKELFFDLALAKQVEYGFIGNDAVGFDEVEHQGFFIIVVGVKESDKGIEPGQDTGFFDLAVKDAIAVIEHGIELIFGGLSASALKFEARRDELGQGCEIAATGAAFNAHNFRSLLIDSTLELLQALLA